MIPSLPLDVQGGIKGGLDDVAVHPLRPTPVIPASAGI